MSSFTSGSYLNSASWGANSALAQYDLPSYTSQVVGSASLSASAPLALSAAPAATLVSAAPAATIVSQVAAPALVAAAAPAVIAAPAVVAAAPLAANFAVPDNVDPNPVVIRKKPAAPVNYTQQVSVKFLQPPPPQQPGDIVITQQKDVQAAPVAPKLIRQRPPLPVKPAPLIVRERPPLAPAPIAPEHHVIPGKVIPPPPRKVIIERLPQLPQPPQDIIVERWLEYGPRARRVVFNPAPRLIPAPAPKNVLIQWDSPNVALNRQFRNLGISPANPAQYVAAFGASLVHPSAIPALAQGIKPVGAVLAAESLPKPVRLVGDVAALSLINRAPALAAAPVFAAAAPAATIVSAAAPAATIVSAAAPALSYAASAPALSYAASAPAYAAAASYPASASWGASASGSYVAASGSAVALSGSGIASGSALPAYGSASW
jgi:hypothetical protein